MTVFSPTLAPVGGGLLVPPNTIDFKAVFANFAERLLDSPVVLSVILGVMLIYIPVMVWARKTDHKDQLKVWFSIKQFNWNITTAINIVSKYNENENKNVNPQTNHKP